MILIIKCNKTETELQILRANRWLSERRRWMEKRNRCGRLQGTNFGCKISHRYEMYSVGNTVNNHEIYLYAKRL